SGGPDYVLVRTQVGGQMRWFPVIVGVHSFYNDANNDNITNPGDTTYSAELTPDVASRLETAIGVPQLSDAAIQFHTADEDKDHNTAVRVDVMASNGTVLAHLEGVEGPLGHFNDHTDSAVLPLQRMPVSSPDYLQPASARIHIDPTGHDTW